MFRRMLRPNAWAGMVAGAAAATHGPRRPDIVHNWGVSLPVTRLPCPPCPARW